MPAAAFNPLPILSDGRLGDGGSFIQYHGHSVNPSRQTDLHAHYLDVDPANHFALGCDLGTDRVMVYQLNPAAATLLANIPPFWHGSVGFGPASSGFCPRRSIRLSGERNGLQLDRF